jgi:hypothetical protein
MSTVIETSNKSDIAKQSDIKEDITEFVRIGRTGRRNAIADVNIDSNINVLPNMNSLTELMRNVNCENEANQTNKT